MKNHFADQVHGPRRFVHWKKWPNARRPPIGRTETRMVRRHLILAAALCLAGCSRAPSLRPLPADAVILAFGDSLTAGTGATPETAYPAVLAELLGVRVVNAGVPGERIAQGRQRLAPWVDETQPALVILCHGGNDLLASSPHAAIREELTAMVRFLRDKEIDVLILAPPKPGLRLKVPSLYRDVARELRVPIDTETLPRVLGSRRMKSDYVHPDEDGYRAIAEALAATIRPGA